MNTQVLSEIAEQEDHGIDRDGERAVMGGIIAEMHSKATRKGAMMGFITLEDQTGQIECLLFPRIYERYSREIQADQAVMITGRLSIREDEEPKLIADVIEPLVQPEKIDTRTDAQRAKDSPVKLYLRLKREKMPRIQEMLLRMRGNIPVYMNLPDEGITLLAPREMWVDDAQDAWATLMSELPQEDMKVVKK